MIQKMESGPAEVIASGSVIAFLGNPIAITFGVEQESLIKVIFEFKDEEGKDKPRIEVNAIDSLTLKITLFDFKNPLGAGNVKPTSIGTIQGRRLYVQFRVYALPNADKTLHYTLYKGEEVAKND